MWGFEVDDGLFAGDGGQDGFAVGGDFHLVVLRFDQDFAELVHDTPVEGQVFEGEEVVLVFNFSVYRRNDDVSLAVTDSPFLSETIG